MRQVLSQCAAPAPKLYSTLTRSVPTLDGAHLTFTGEGLPHGMAFVYAGAFVVVGQAAPEIGRAALEQGLPFTL
jgi:hypothetical protein